MALSPEGPTTKPRGLFGRLYHGETEFDFIGRSKVWFAISGLVILAGLVGLFARGLNLGIEFEGGAVWDFPANDQSIEDIEAVMADEGVAEARVQTLEADGEIRFRVQSESLGVDREQEIARSLAETIGEQSSDVNLNSVGPSWGEEITEKAVRALIVFLIAITIYVTFRFEFKMAMATLLALFHDIFVTVGVYALFGFEVTPATVIAFLTILGYSIYDGIVVFDRVDENTRLVSSTNRVTYSSMVNLSLNQTLMRSLNTQIAAMIPMLSLLIIGSVALGAETLEEFGLALLIGQIAGAYSSIFIASPALAILKEREPRFKDVRKRIEARDASSAAGSTGSEGSAPAVAPQSVATAALAAEGDDESGAEGKPSISVAAPSGPTTVRPAPTTGTVIPPRPRKKSKRR